MNTELINKCNLLVKNRDAIHKAFKWDIEAMALAGSSFYVGLNQEVDLEKLKECEDILKSKSGVLSEYRGNVKMPVLCKMAASANPQRYLDEIQSIVEEMKDLKWIDKGYKVLSAITIHDHAEPVEYRESVVKMTELYQNMKENHPWLTSGEDIPFAAMLAVSGLETDALVKEMEVCYSILNDHFHSKDAVQSLSHILSVNPAAPDEKCRKVEQIWDLLKAKGHKFGSGLELAVLGTLCTLDCPIETIAEEIVEADEYLKAQKGFGNLTRGEKSRRMYAALMVMDTHVPPASRSHESALDTTLAIVIAMEICMVILMSSICVTTVSM